MLMHQLLNPERSTIDLSGGSKKRVLELISQIIAEGYEALDQGAIFSALIARERIGSTGVGMGVAIPHCRLAELEEPIAHLFRLESPIDYDSPDKQPVDLMFVLIVPQEATSEHLEILASVAEKFIQEPFRNALRQAKDGAAMYDVVVDYV